MHPGLISLWHFRSFYKITLTVKWKPHTHLNPCAVKWRYSWSSWLFPFTTDGGWLDEVFRIKRGLPEQTDRGHYSSTRVGAAAMPDRFLLSIVIYWRLTSHLSGSHCPQSFTLFLKQQFLPHQKIRGTAKSVWKHCLPLLVGKCTRVSSYASVPVKTCLNVGP